MVFFYSLSLSSLCLSRSLHHIISQPWYFSKPTINPPAIQKYPNQTGIGYVNVK